MPLKLVMDIIYIGENKRMHFYKSKREKLILTVCGLAFALLVSHFMTTYFDDCIVQSLRIWI